MLDIVIMAAGLGTRMRSERAKVLHSLGGQSLVSHVLRAAAALSPDRIVVVVGHQADDVESVARATAAQVGAPEPVFVVQREQLGTGHAVQQAVDALSGGTVVVLSGDVPLIESATLQSLLDAHTATGSAATILSTRLDDPLGYGRIVRNAANGFERIVEHRDADENERRIDEINSGIYAFDAADLAPSLANLSSHNAQGEYYLTDVLGMLVEAGRPVAVVLHTPSNEVLGINSRLDLAESEALLRRRTLERLMLSGVTVVDPATTYVDSTVTVGRDTLILPGTMLSGTTSVGGGCTIGPYVQVLDATIEDGVTIRAMSVVEGARVARGGQIGPFARLRPGAALAEDVHIGNFVEIKNTVVGKGSKANHLTYLGDAEVGAGCNIGAGTVTCNYDGKRKHKTTIEDGVYIGSDTMLVAPVRVGRGSKTGAGAVVTRDVPAESLAVGMPARVMRSLGEGEK